MRICLILIICCFVFLYIVWVRWSCVVVGWLLGRMNFLSGGRFVFNLLIYVLSCLIFFLWILIVLIFVVWFGDWFLCWVLFELVFLLEGDFLFVCSLGEWFVSFVFKLKRWCWMMCRWCVELLFNGMVMIILMIVLSLLIELIVLIRGWDLRIWFCW